MTRNFSKKSIRMAKKLKKRCTTSVDIREMPIKPTTYHVVPTTRAKMKRWIIIASVGKDAVNSHCWWECKTMQSLCKTAWQSLQRLNTEFLWPSDSTWMLKESLLITAKRGNSQRCSIDECINSMWYKNTVKHYPVMNREWSWHSHHSLDFPLSSVWCVGEARNQRPYSVRFHSWNV